MHEQFATETDEDPTIIGDYDPSFQLILRRHGLTAMPRDADPDREWLEVLEAGDTSISMPSSLLNDLDHDPSYPTTTVMYASPALVQSTAASSTSRPASSTKDQSPSKSPTGAHSPKSTSPVTDNSTGSSVVVIDADEAREATAATTGPIFTRKESPRKKEDALEIDAVSSAAMPDPWQLSKDPWITGNAHPKGSPTTLSPRTVWPPATITTQAAKTPAQPKAIDIFTPRPETTTTIDDKTSDYQSASSGSAHRSSAEKKGWTPSLPAAKKVVIAEPPATTTEITHPPTVPKVNLPKSPSTSTTSAPNVVELAQLEQRAREAPMQAIGANGFPECDEMERKIRETVSYTHLTLPTKRIV